MASASRVGPRPSCAAPAVLHPRHRTSSRPPSAMPQGTPAAAAALSQEQQPAAGSYERLLGGGAAPAALRRFYLPPDRTPDEDQALGMMLEAHELVFQEVAAAQPALAAARTRFSDDQGVLAQVGLADNADKWQMVNRTYRGGAVSWMYQTLSKGNMPPALRFAYAKTGIYPPPGWPTPQFDLEFSGTPDRVLMFVATLPRFNHVTHWELMGRYFGPGVAPPGGPSFDELYKRCSEDKDAYELFTSPFLHTRMLGASLPFNVRPGPAGRAAVLRDVRDAVRLWLHWLARDAEEAAAAAAAGRPWPEDAALGAECVAMDDALRNVTRHDPLKHLVEARYGAEAVEHAMLTRSGEAAL